MLYGGASSERDISLESGKGIYEALDQLGYFVTLKDFNNLEKLEDLKKYDLVFIALHGFEGESGILQKDLDNLGILYTGSKYLSCKNTWKSFQHQEVFQSKESIQTCNHHLITLIKNTVKIFKIYS